MILLEALLFHSVDFKNYPIQKNEVPDHMFNQIISQDRLLLFSFGMSTLN